MTVAGEDVMPASKGKALDMELLAAVLGGGFQK